MPKGVPVCVCAVCGRDAIGRDDLGAWACGRHIAERTLALDGLEIPVVIDPDCEHLGVVEWNSDFTNHPTTPTRIVLRAWSERVFLHETLHCLIGDNEALVRRATQLYDLGWRLAA